MSNLRYHGTDEEVLLGDRIELKSLILRRKRRGTVVCIPDKTALELDAENKQPQDWLIKLDNGTYTGWMYHPEDIQPNSRLRLLGRGADYEPITNDELERQDNEIASRSSPLYDALGCAIIIIVVVIVFLVLL